MFLQKFLFSINKIEIEKEINMKLNYQKTGIFLVLMVFSFLILPFTSYAALNDSDYIVQELEVNDVPNDDGSGLIISWKPLPKERRIIEYRVYRGVTPDTLFAIGKIDVNVKTGVPGDKVYFYDTAFNSFLDITARGKMKTEKGQPKTGPIYRGYPRDISITGPQLKNYKILGVIPDKDYFWKNHKIEQDEGDEKRVYAGMKLRNISMYKKLLDNKEYYYTVIAVNEARHYFPYAEPVVGIPRENAPEKTEEFFPVFVKDLNRLQFEWSLPIYDSDMYYHSIYMLKKEDLEKFNDYTAELKEIEMNDLAVIIDSTVTPLEQKLSNPAELIYMRYSGYPYTPSKTVSLNITDGRIIGEKTYKNEVIGKEYDVDVPIDIENIENYYFIFSLFDTSAYETFSDPKPLDIVSSNQLPKIPPFTVTDRDDDKGDYNYIMWGKPVVYLTNSTYLNDSRTKIKVNYDIMTNKEYEKINNIFFKVFNSDGNQIQTINEYYQDSQIKVKLPKGSDPEQSLTFEMTVKSKGKLNEDYVITQDLVFDDKSKSLKPGELYLVDQRGNKEDVYKNGYYVYKRNYSNEEFRLSKKLNGSQRELSDNITYFNKHFKLVSKFDEKKNLFLVSPSLSIRLDHEDRTKSVGMNLYPSEIGRTLERYKKELADYQTMKDTVKTDEEREQAQEGIDRYQELIDNYMQHPIQKRAMQLAEENKLKERTKFLYKSRKYASNSYEYKIVKSDGKGHFSETSIYSKAGDEPVETNEFNSSLEGFGTDHFYPKSDWFKSKMFPSLIAALIFGLLVFIMVGRAKKGHDLFIRPIAGIQEIDNAIGRATEMGRPILFVPGLSGIQDVATLAALAILGRVAKKAAEYDTKILVPVKDYIVLPIAQEIVKEAHYEAGRPDTYDKGSVFFITTAQFAFVAGVNGVMIREKTATNFYMGMFYAESLIMTETGCSTGAIQIAGTDAVTQIPFFITTCDYTLIGEELYAASAYLAREPLMLGTLKAQDYFKFLILAFVIAGTVLSSSHLTFLINAFPDK